MKKLTKTMMIGGIMASMMGAGAFMYMKNSKKNINKYMSYLNNNNN